ncbi:1-phosphatidylinositol 4,5-bisphosphate phosphodiesterase eta-2 isoform X2 [Nematostella vectensis]|uniref:1-phosphatidylinositol 4,5-bisphosphate phosphodiesterase eta-2 isoform X2 n=1 Tax=Nematostella vectensis TaxID=45351 RepID=UPI00207727AB|nr:1-phosphatidylinositol 4,5-bisphosphate phosphodiesterase eta-2 isoform X2 [Nematostella vectensis]
MADLQEQETHEHFRFALKPFQKWREAARRGRAAKSAGNDKFATVDESIALMRRGSELIKLRSASKKYPRTYFLDSELANISWTPSKKGDRAKIPVNTVKEIREGTVSDAFSQCSEVFPEERCFTLIHGESFATLDLVAANREEAMHWMIGLRYLMAQHYGENEPTRRQKARDLWLRGIYTAADKSGDGLLSIDEVYFLMHKLNVKISNRQVRENFKAADTDTVNSSGLLDFEEFANFYKSISTRRELYMLLLKYGNSKENMTVQELLNFLRIEQRVTECDEEYCSNIIQTYEPADSNKKNMLLGIDGFTSYLLSADGEIFNPEHSDVYQDMTRPLSHYFIASSHNTYLTGDQLASASSMDMYVRVLQSGCRCLELDCWDGKDGEPVVYHGYTMTSKVKFRYVILNINDFAFLNNRYPVILSLENHCSVEQQKFMANFMRDTFKDKVMYSDMSDGKDLPSPQELMGKILIKTKKLPVALSEDLEEGEVTEEDSADEMDECFKFRSDENEVDHRAKERKCRRTLASLQRLRMNKEDDESDARGDLSSAIVSSVASGNTSETRQRGLRHTLKRSFSTKENKEKKRKEVTKSRSFSTADEDPKTAKKVTKRKRSRALSREMGSKRTIRLSRHLSDLVAYTQSRAFKGLEVEEDEKHWEVISIPEPRAYRFTDTKATQFTRYTRYKLCRIYPAGYRIDSSNPNPQTFWNCGCQLVALNYQTEGRMLQINRGKFRANGNCGYVLKPDILCKESQSFDPMTRKDIPGVSKKVLKIRVISGQQLPKPKDSILGDRGEIIDPYVEVEIIGIPADTSKYRTKTVIDNGFNPVWEETMVFLLNFPDIALVRFVVWDEDPIGRDFIGQMTLPFQSIMPGFRHVHLEGLDQATVFCHVTIMDYTTDKALDITDNIVRERHQSGGVKFKRRGILRNNSS